MATDPLIGAPHRKQLNDSEAGSPARWACARLPGVLYSVQAPPAETNNHLDMAVSRRATWVTLGLALGATAWVSSPRHQIVRAASGADPFLDTDADLLPDALEWVAFADPTKPDTDFDSGDDFLEVVQHTAPYARTAARPFDNEMRILLSQVSGASDVDDSEIWLNCLFRFAGGTPTVDWFVPYIHTTGGAVPIGELFGRTPFRLSFKPVPGGGTYALLTMFLAREREFASLLPCTVSARASVGGRAFSTGTYVFGVDGAIAALMPAGLDGLRKTFMLQTLSSESSSTSFFRRNKICEMELAVIGSTSGGHICEVDRASCEPANGLRCNVSCDQAAGAMVFVPDGLGTITGG